MAVNPLACRSDWTVAGHYAFQVVPQAKNPGYFTARVIVPREGKVPPNMLQLMLRAVQCEWVTAGQVFFENPEIARRDSASAIGDENVGMLPCEMAACLQPSQFPDGLRLFAIQPGQRPEEPSYEFWTRDIARSMQVVDGDYLGIVPYSFEFAPTVNCIFRCHQCAYRQPKERMGVWAENRVAPEFHMDLRTMKFLLERIRESGATEVLFTGGGEPLLNRDTPAAMSYTSRDLGLKVGLYTNGALITKSKTREILQSNPAYVRVSLNAGTRDVYVRHHNPVSHKIDYFTRTTNAIRYLGEAKRAADSKTIIGISYLVDPDNADDAVNGARLIAGIATQCPGQINYMRFTPSVNYFGPDQHPQRVFEDALKRIEREAVPMLAAAGVEASIYFHRFSGLYEQRQYSRCLAYGWYGEVGPGGMLFHCCERLLDPHFAIGSLLDCSFEELWHGERRRQVLEFVSRAVRGETECPCPVVCKPNEHNKVFNRIERLRMEGNIEIVRAWLEQIHQIVARSQKGPSRLFGFSAEPG
jgi:cyclic pyranopterin phosphate synthase